MGRGEADTEVQCWTVGSKRRERGWLKGCRQGRMGRVGEREVQCWTLGSKSTERERGWLRVADREGWGGLERGRRSENAVLDPFLGSKGLCRLTIPVPTPYTNLLGQS